MSKKTLYISLGVLFLSLVIFDVVVWIYFSSNSQKPFEAAVQDYLNFYGGIFENAMIATLRNIIFCILAIICFVLAINSYRESRRHGGLYGLIIFTGLLCAWHLFSLM